MKAIYFTLFLFLSMICEGQSSINYKAIIKDSDGNVVANQSIAVEFSILEFPTLSVLYQESHTPNTDQNGLITVNIGEGLPISTGSISDVNWAAPNNHGLNVKVDIGNGLVDMGTTQFLMVPYALYAREVGNKDDADANPTNEIQTLTQTNNTITLSDGGGSFDLPEQKWLDGTGDNIYKNDGRVSIGTSIPSAKLDVQDNAVNGNAVQIYKTNISSGNDALEIVVPEGAPNNAQFIEMQRGLTGDIVAKVDTDGSATFKSLEVTDDEILNNDTPEKGRVYSNALPIAYGLILSNSTIVSDFGIDSVNETSEGRYDVTLDRTVTGEPIIMATIYATSNNFGKTIVAYYEDMTDTIKIIVNDTDGQPIFANFYIMVFGRTSN